VSAVVALFDELTGLPRPTHSRDVLSALRQVASVVCLLVLAQGAATECAGWQATPEARMECCEEGICPLHGHDDEASRTSLTQSAVDSCCAQSARHESGLSATVVASTITLAVLRPLPPAVVSLAPAMLRSAPWETPSPPLHVPKHLLLSVLLV
jgi:hypothetical protein